MIKVISGSRILVPAATVTAQKLGVPQDVIAATMAALGTSLPELSTAISALGKHQGERFRRWQGAGCWRFIWFMFLLNTS